MIHCSRGPQNTRDLPVAFINRFPDLPRKFWRFAELFGNFRKGHEVDRDRLDDFRMIFRKYAVDLP